MSDDQENTRVMEMVKHNLEFENQIQLRNKNIVKDSA